MVNKDKALKLALEALESGVKTQANRITWTEYDSCLVNEAITAIKEALAQLEQEPVAWMTINEYGEEDDIHYENPEGHLLEGWTCRPLYTISPPAQAQEESLELFEYWNAVEGWVKIEEVRKHFSSVGCGTIYKTAGEDRVTVYTAPPKRPWVELTAPEIVKIVNAHDDLPLNLAFAIEAKLKEKNT